jgi:hypothetical protein
VADAAAIAAAAVAIAGAADATVVDATTSAASVSLVGGLCASARSGVSRGVIPLRPTHKVCESRSGQFPEVLLW